MLYIINLYAYMYISKAHLHFNICLNSNLSIGNLNAIHQMHAFAQIFNKPRDVSHISPARLIKYAYEIHRKSVY